MILVVITIIAIITVLAVTLIFLFRYQKGKPSQSATVNLGELSAPASAPEVVPALEQDYLEAKPPSLEERLVKSRGIFRRYLSKISSVSAFSDSAFEELEELLISSDVGIDESMAVISELQKEIKEAKIETSEDLIKALKELLVRSLIFENNELSFSPSKPTVWLVVGVNGSGKTTTIAKLAHRLKKEGKSVLLAAGDTFRAAAQDQLEIWASRVSADIVTGQVGADPASIIHDAIISGSKKGVDVVIADTAGRIQTKVNLMNELRKIKKVASREPGNLTETLMVLDATTGQNGLSQAKEFFDVADVSGIVLTKLDGTAKGGIVFRIARELKIPVKLIGVGESIEDLVTFDPQAFVDALFAQG